VSITPSRIDELAIALTDPHVEIVAMKRETAEELLVEIEALRIERSVFDARHDGTRCRSQFCPCQNRPSDPLCR